MIKQRCLSRDTWLVQPTRWSGAQGCVADWHLDEPVWLAACGICVYLQQYRYIISYKWHSCDLVRQKTWAWAIWAPGMPTALMQPGPGPRVQAGQECTSTVCAPTFLGLV